MANKNEAVDTREREIITTRVLNAPRALVFEAFTNRAHVEKWWGPDGFSTTVHSMDVRPGGEWQLTMHGPDGREYRNKMIFEEIVKPERLVFRHTGEDGFEHATHYTIVTLEAIGDKTQVDLRLVFDTAEERDRVATEYHAVEGGRQTMGRLEAYMPLMPALKEVTIVRTLNAPRELVFKVWTDPAHLAQWWGPRGFSAPDCEVDLRIGGALRICMDHPAFPNHWMTGVFLEIKVPERLVFSSRAFINEQGDASLEQMNTILFEEENGKTKLTIHAVITKATPEMAPALAGMDQGWKETIDKLGEYLDAQQ